MSKIGNRPPPTGPNDPSRAAEAPKTADAKTATKPGAAASPSTPKAPDDQFARAAQAGSQFVASQLKGAGAKVQFSNEDFAYLAATFAALIKQNPGADRKKRAQLFTKAILKFKKLKLTPQQQEDMAESIGEMLSGSPVFGELVDEVTHGARNMNAGG